MQRRYVMTNEPPTPGSSKLTYYVMFLRLIYMADESDNKVMPWFVVVTLPNGRIVRQDVWSFMTPIEDEDVDTLKTLFAPESTLVCLPSFQPQLARVLGRAVTVVPMPHDDLPAVVKDVEENMRDAMRSSDVCYSCTNDYGGAARMAVPAGTGCAGCTPMLANVPGITDAFVRSLLGTCQRFWRARPVRGF